MGINVIILTCNYKMGILLHMYKYHLRFICAYNNQHDYHLRVL